MNLRHTPLAQSFPDAALAPFDDPRAHEAMRAKVPEPMTECFELIESALIEGPRVRGERYSIRDPYLLTLSEWLAGDGMDRARFPKVAAHAAPMYERPAVQAAWPLHFGTAPGEPRS